MLIDTHTHLESFARKGALNVTLEEARAAGVDTMITIGTAPEDWSLYRDIAVERGGLVRFTAGLHPCSVEAGWESAVAQIEAFWDGALPNRGAESAGYPGGSGTPSPMTFRLPVALGECGLDRFHLPKDPAEAERIFAWQRAAFEAQLAIAKRLGAVVVVHSRGAFRECVEMIDASGVDWTKVVFHCFTEGEAEMQELVKRGGFGSFTGILTYKTAENIRQAAKRQGLSRFMLETDAPYLTPMPHRGKPNVPAYVKHTAEFAAQHVFGVSYQELAAISSATAKRFFGL